MPPGDDARLSVVPWIFTDKRKALAEQVTTAWIERKRLGVKDLDLATVVSEYNSGSGDSDVVSVDSGVDSDEDLGEGD